MLLSKLSVIPILAIVTRRPQTAGALSLHRSVERLIDLEDGNDSGLVNTGFNTSDEKNSPSQEATAPRTPSSPKKQLARQKSHEVLLAQSSPLSSPEISTHSTKQDTDVNQKSLRLNFVDPQQEADQEILQLNPLTTILTNEQLLLFATQPISPQTTLQCTIIRDKKGIDRSLYPTYFMHLQGKQITANVANGLQHISTFVVKPLDCQTAYRRRLMACATSNFRFFLYF